MNLAKEYNLDLIEESCASTKEFICGTEYEIENILKVNLKGFNGAGSSVSWFGDLGAITDGSLRNKGIEFVTRPVTFERALVLFDVLHGGLELGPEPYTTRTSTHVHVNVASMSSHQLKHFVLLYALFEPVFFNYVGDARKHNIHCVPLNYTLLPKHYGCSASYLVDIWSKYTAFNLKPVKTQGTVEFRHLYGTGDKQVYQQWLSMLKELWSFAFNNKHSWLKDQLKEKTSPKDILMQVLPSAPISSWNMDFSDSLIDVKLAFV